MSNEHVDRAIEQIENALEDIKEEFERTIPQRAQDELWYAKNGVVDAARAYLRARSALDSAVRTGKASLTQEMARIQGAENEMAYHLKRVDAIETQAHPRTSVVPVASAQDTDVHGVDRP